MSVYDRLPAGHHLRPVLARIDSEDALYHADSMAMVIASWEIAIPALDAVFPRLHQNGGERLDRHVEWLAEKHNTNPTKGGNPWIPRHLRALVAWIESHDLPVADVPSWTAALDALAPSMDEHLAGTRWADRAHHPPKLRPFTPRAHLIAHVDHALQPGQWANNSTDAISWLRAWRNATPAR